MPVASVIIPSYNRKTLTDRAIKSVFSQTFKDYELILINDGSSEDYHLIQSKIEKEKQIYINQANLGVAASRNAGIKKARGEYIFLLDSDDEWLPEKLEKQMEYFRENPDARILQTKEKWFRFNKHVQIPKHLEPGVGDCFIRSLSMCSISSSSVGFKRELIEKVGLYNEKLRVCEDYDFWLRSLLYYKIDLLDSVQVVKYSGEHEQLSNSEVAIDRYRLFSLVSLLRFIKENNLSLEVEKADALIEVLQNKAKILLNGAVKRGLESEMQIYQGILDSDLARLTLSELALLLDSLEITLSYRPKI